MTDTLQALYASTADLYARFGLDDTLPETRRPFFSEESRELVEASVRVEFYREIERLRGGNIDAVLTVNLIEEAADVFVTVVGLLLAHGIDCEDFDAAIQRVIDKNDAKTAANGYAVLAGKIRKATP